MRLVSLRMKGFRVFAQEQIIEFPRNGLILLTGPSGSGKSSILQAIGFALGYSSFAASKQQSWVTEDAMQVDLEIENDDGDGLLIRRGKVTQAMLNGEVVAKGPTDLNKWLLSYFGVEPAMLKAMSFQPQRSNGAFLNMKNDARRTFLTSVLGLQRYESALKKIKEDTTAAFNKRREKEVAIETMRENLPAYTPLGVQTLYIKGIAGVDAETNYADADLIALFAPLSIDWGARKGDAMKNIDEHRQKLKEAEAERDAQLAGVRANNAKELWDIEEASNYNERALMMPKPRVSDGILAGRLEKVKSKVAELDAEIKEGDKEIRRLVNQTPAKAEYAVLKQKMETQATHLRHAKGQQCPTCKQQWLTCDIGAEERKSDKLQEELLAVEERIAVDERLEKEAYGRREEFEAQRKKFNTLWQTTADAYQAEQNAIRVEHQKACEALEVQRQAIRAEAQIQKNVARGRHAKAETEAALAGATAIEVQRVTLSGLEDGLRKLIEAGAEFQKCYAQLVGQQKVLKAERAANDAAAGQRKGAEIRLEAAQKAFAELDTSYAELEDLSVAMKAFLSIINDEILAEIAEETNEMLAGLPNAKMIRVAFRTERLNDAGDLKSEIKAVVSYGDQEDIDPESQLSGGQLTSVELATDRGAASVLRRRRGGHRMPDWVNLDEAFNGHDDETKEACREILQRIAADSQVIIVDHSAGFKAAFDKVIRVTPFALGSTVTVE